MKKIFFLSILFCVFTLSAQSPWTQEKGKFYTQLSFSTIPDYDEIYSDPDYQLERNITDNTLQLYGEYGLSNKTTLIANIPIKLIKTDELVRSSSVANDVIFTTADSKTAIGNIAVGLKHKFVDKKWLVSGQFNIEANTGSFDTASGIRSGQDAWTFTPTINIGRSFESFYIQGFAGVDLKTNSYSSNFKIGGEIGTKILDKVSLIGFIDVVHSFNNGDVAIPINNKFTALYVNNQEYTAIGLKTIGEFTNNFGGLLSIGGALSGNNVAKQVVFTVGVYHKF